jgi:subfamily B ATP-binding cassette protein HlyB/CyaB
MASRILTLERGRLIEDGTHEDLLAKGGRYASLYAIQGGRMPEGGAA